MSVKERVIGIVMNRPAKPDPQDVPLGIQQLVASGVPFVISPNPDLVYEGIPAPDITAPVLSKEMVAKFTTAWDAQWTGVDCAARVPPVAPEMVCPDGDSWAKVETDSLGAEVAEVLETLDDVLTTPVHEWEDSPEAVQCVGGAVPLGTVAPKVGEQVQGHFTPLVPEKGRRIQTTLFPAQDATSFPEFPDVSLWTTYTAPPEPRIMGIGLTPQQIAALDALVLGCSVQVMNRLHKLADEITFIKTKLGLDS